MDEKSKETIDARISANKQNMLSVLEEYPVVRIACKKVGVARATYYRWIAEDKAFSKAVKKSMKLGIALVNDVAEENLIEMIYDKNLPAMKYWLRSRHDEFNRSGYVPVLYTK